MKKKFFAGALVGLMSIPMVVNAEGVASVEFEGQSNVNVGDEFKVNMIIDNVDSNDGGVVAFGGFISFDNNVLQLVSSQKGDAYDVVINKNINKIAALDYTLANGVYNRTNVYTMTFKAIGEGNTSVTLRDGELTDRTSDLDFTVESLNVNSVNYVPTTATPITTETVKKEVMEETVSNEVSNESNDKVSEIKSLIENFFKTKK